MHMAIIHNIVVELTKSMHTCRLLIVQHYYENSVFCLSCQYSVPLIKVLLQIIGTAEVVLRQSTIKDLSAREWEADYGGDG